MTQRLLLKIASKSSLSSENESGYILVVTVVMAFILSSLFITAAIMSKFDTSSTRASAKSSKGFYAAEAGINLRAKQIKDKFRGFESPSGVAPDGIESCKSSSPNKTGQGDYQCEQFTIGRSLDGSSRDIQTVYTFVKPHSSTEKELTDGPFRGLKAQEYRYDVRSVAYDNNDLPTSSLKLSFRNRLIPLFQFAVFFENDADFTIPPDMTLNGRIHSNHDLYLNSAGSSYALSIFGQVTTAGKLFRGNKSAVGSQQCAGNVRIRTQFGTVQNLNCIDSTSITPYSMFTTAPSNISQWGENIGIGVDYLTPPSPDAFDPSPGNLYWDKADLRIALKLDSSNNPVRIEVRTPSNAVNTTLTDKLNQSCPVLKGELKNPINYNADENQLSISLRPGHTLGDEADTDSVFTTIGTDIDSNVISSLSSDTANFYRRLAHNYQNGENFSPGTPVRQAVVSTSNTFYNFREKHKLPGPGDGILGTEIRLLDVNIEALLKCAQDQNLMGAGKGIDDATDGGLVWFFTVDGPDSALDLTGRPQDSNANVTGNTYGIRLYNGANLDAAGEIKGLSIVSDQAVYIQGNYNLGDTGQQTAPYSSRKPAAIMGDSINILSNKWRLDDSNARSYNSGLPDSSSIKNFNAEDRRASETSINAAFLAGTEITGGGNGATTQLGSDSGGVNNYPRFHEDWSGIPLNYQGSLISLNEPRRVNSPFCGSRDSDRCNIYSPPIRNWDFDENFTTASKLPPLSPRAVYLKQENFTRQFMISRVNDSDEQNSIPELLAKLQSYAPRFTL